MSSSSSSPAPPPASEQATAQPDVTSNPNDKATVDQKAKKQQQQGEKQQKQNQPKDGGKGKGGNNNNNNAAASSKPKGAVQVNLPPPPPFLADRLKLWDEYKQKRDEELKNLPDVPIKVTLPDGKAIDAVAWKTTPYDIAKGISRGLANDIVVAKVNDKYHDIHRPIEVDSTLQLFKFDSPEGKHCFWHSSAHVLGQALERKYGAHLTVGPALDEGFYYDSDIPVHAVSDANPNAGAVERVSISSDSLEELNAIANQIVKEKQPFERLAVPRDVALKMFEYNKFKQEIIGKIPADETVSLYRSGPLIDLCRGPHLPNTSFIKAYHITKNSGAYWMGKQDQPLLQRVYGIAFPDQKQLDQWIEFQKQAALRDHRTVGKAQGLFFFHPYSPGSAFMLPHGARIYNRLMAFTKAEYHRRGFTEVMTPNMYNKALWETSGHWQNYKDDMFVFDCDATEFSLKPMNCPGHCLMFDHTARSYRELPLRFADFGVLHRNELAGALTGLTRVRRFQQDDAHIFCAPEMIQNEIKNCLDFMKYVYGVFGYQFQLGLSTRPAKAMGDIETWDKAEKMIADALDAFGQPWKLNPGDGAFYGPKIDILVTDALNRQHQCATIQLDFQLPKNFNLKYTDQEGKEVRPVIIHRAIYGSIERMMAILIEHTGGKWPFWLSPRQCIVLSVAQSHNAYVQKVHDVLHAAGYYVDVNLSDNTINKKIREAQVAQYNYILVAGDQEVASETVNVRTRDEARHGEKTVQDMLKEFAELTQNFK